MAHHQKTTEPISQFSRREADSPSLPSRRLPRENLKLDINNPLAEGGGGHSAEMNTDGGVRLEEIILRKNGEAPFVPIESPVHAEYAPKTGEQAVNELTEMSYEERAKHMARGIVANTPTKISDNEFEYKNMEEHRKWKHCG